MKRINISILALAALSISSLQAIEMTDYKIIEGSYEEAYVNGAFTTESGNQDKTSYKGHLDGNFKTIHTTAPYTWSVDGIVNSDFTQGKDANSSAENTYDTFLRGRADKYLNNDDTIFLYGSADVGYRKQLTANTADDLYSKVGAGAGYGRRYDATPLAYALRIVEDLTRNKILTKPVSDKGMLALAKVLNLKNQYRSKYGLYDYKRYWYADMEKALKDAGALEGDSLGAFGIVRINEIIDLEKISGRFHGWKVRGGLGRILTNYNGSDGATTADAEFDYGLPMGYSSQFREIASASKVLETSSNLDYKFGNIMTYTYEIADRIDWENGWQLAYEKYDVGDDIMTNSFSTGFRYYLANRLTFDTTFSLTKTDGTNGSTVETPDWNTKFVTSIRYRLK